MYWSYIYFLHKQKENQLILIENYADKWKAKETSPKMLKKKSYMKMSKKIQGQKNLQATNHSVANWVE